ncbi:hypothetical protein A9Q99_21690 [Gammaproteobacteria bacterium 45_16_T64]|nr:hypothetical protein A9Q99_21690 [Gammaproteobacteria bacterium 45_16_T64]
MSRQRRNFGRKTTRSVKVPSALVEATIEKLSHDGRGIARVNGKTTFVEGSLAGEMVEFAYTQCHSRYDEAKVTRILTPSVNRVIPRCEHVSTCGGCSLQHLNSEAQIQLKQSTLMEQLAHFGDVTPEHLLVPIEGGDFGYRRKARLAIKYSAKGNATVGFRAKSSSQVVAISHCPVLVEGLGDIAAALERLINGLTGRKMISHIDAVQGDSATALVFRHVKDLPNDDFQALLSFCQERQLHLYLQPDKGNTTYRVWPEIGDERLSFFLAEYDLEIRFHPMDFIQVNGSNNARMVQQAVDLLEVKETDRVLDLFCGVGNFTLPIARLAEKVVGVEGNDAMVAQAKENAFHNSLSNVEFHGTDLSNPFKRHKWAKQGFNKVLIDPPRAGALEIVKNIADLAPEKIVYVSCNPATLARDAGELNKLGYRMVKAGVVDMFPHTTHIESIVLFEQSSK